MRVALRLPREADVAAHMALPPSVEMMRMYGHAAEAPPAPSEARSRDWYERLSATPHPRVIETNGAAVGAVLLREVDETDRHARLAIGLWGERNLGRGIGRRAIGLMLDEAFGDLGLHRVALRVLAFNTRAIRCYEACGFRREGVEREAALVGGQRHDDVVMGILAREHPHRA